MQKEGLEFSDGLKFGCGFFVAWILGSVIISILMGIVVFALGMLMPGFLSGMGFPSSIP
ncbi:MAG: hypothetical protein ACUVV0_17235 [Anaerolineae bacterium]